MSAILFWNWLTNKKFRRLIIRNVKIAKNESQNTFGPLFVCWKQNMNHTYFCRKKNNSQIWMCVQKTVELEKQKKGCDTQKEHWSMRFYIMFWQYHMRDSYKPSHSFGYIYMSTELINTNQLLILFTILNGIFWSHSNETWDTSRKWHTVLIKRLNGQSKTDSKNIHNLVSWTSYPHVERKH